MSRQIPAAWKNLLNDAGFKSLRELALKAKVSAPSVARLVHRDGKTTDATIQAVAQALAVNPSDLYALAGIKTHHEAGPYTPPDVSARLTTRQRRLVDELIRCLVDPTPNKNVD